MKLKTNALKLKARTYFALLLAVSSIAVNCSSTTKTAVVSPRAKIAIPTMNLAITQQNFSLFRDSMTTEFMKMGINVIDRNYVEKVLQEHQFNQTGLTDPNSRRELGKLLGATAIAVLDFTPENFPKASVQIIDIETGAILISASYAYSAGMIKNLNPDHAEVTEIIGKEIRNALDI